MSDRGPNPCRGGLSINYVVCEEWCEVPPTRPLATLLEAATWLQTVRHCGGYHSVKERRYRLPIAPVRQAGSNARIGAMHAVPLSRLCGGSTCVCGPPTLVH